VLLLGCFWAHAAVAQNEVFLTLDPGTAKPTVVAEPSPASVLVIRSINYLDITKPEPFLLRFPLSFVGQYKPGSSDPSVVTTSGVVFQSHDDTYNPPGGGGPYQVQVVKIQIDPTPANPRPPDGFKYDVLMGAEVLDPRIRPR